MVVVPRKVRSKDKVIDSRKTLVAILDGLKAQGKVVVLTNGVYDLMHVGHIRCLEDARSRGDFLVVGVNSDRSAKALKGKGLPMIPAAERKEMISALWFVDYVIEFDEDDAEELIRAIKPSIYAKGTEYKLSTLPERQLLKELDIKAVFVGDKKAHSTTKLIQKIRKMKLD